MFIQVIVIELGSFDQMQQSNSVQVNKINKTSVQSAIKALHVT